MTRVRQNIQMLAHCLFMHCCSELDHPGGLGYTVADILSSNCSVDNSVSLADVDKDRSAMDFDIKKGNLGGGGGERPA
jgi:hypothetical protein